MKFRKILSVALCLILLLSIFGCGSSQYKVTSYTDENGNFVTEREGRTSVSWKSLPATIPYNDKEIYVNDISFYENLSSSYSYALFAVADLDFSNLDDSDIHWLNESDMDISIYLTSEQNEYDFDSMNYLGSLLNTEHDHCWFVFTSSFFKENRHSFAQSRAYLSIDLEQEDTYEYTNSDGDTSNLHKECSVSYSVDLPESLPTTDEIDSLLQEYIAKWLHAEAEKLEF